MRLRRWILLVVAGLITPLLFTQCDNDNDGETTTVNFKMTDAPIDNTEVEAVFVTVSDIKVDGQSVDGFEKQTIDLTAYQNGNAILLASEQMDVQSYNNVSLVLDYDQDASGNSPGCYVLTDDNIKHNLNATSQSQSEMMVGEGFDARATSTNNVVIDFDLRKSITNENEMNSESDYSFVTQAEIEGALRAVVESNAGSIQGQSTNNSSSEGAIVVYAYHKGEFDSTTETSGQGSSNVLFANAVTSAKVESDGSYTLSFLEEGEYGVHVVNYEENSEGEMEFQGMMNASSSTSGILLGEIMVEANAEITLHILISSIIG